MPVKLTEELLQKNPLPKQRKVLFDKNAAGLSVRGGPRGWVFSFQGKPQVAADGKVSRPMTALGSWSPIPGAGLSVHEARERALALMGKTGAQVPVGLSVRHLAETWLERRYGKNRARRAKVAALLETHALPFIGGLPVRAVTRAHCEKLVQEASVQRRVAESTAGSGSVLRGGSTPAAALCRVLKQLFRAAVKSGQLSTLAESPAELLEERDFGIAPSVPRQRWLDAEAMAMLLRCADVDLPGLLAGSEYKGLLGLPARVAIILGPHLAVRPSALTGMRWEELDLDAATWTIGDARASKLRQHLRASAPPHVVPLSTTAVAVLRVLRGSSETPETQWVLRTSAKVGHLTGDVLADALLRLTGANGRCPLPKGRVRPHDARRTFASTATRLGIDRYVVERCLQHSLGKVSDTYMVDTSLERRRQAHELVDAHWSRARGEPAKVIAMAGRPGID